MRWHWPGNIRELENVIERAVILSSGPVLHVPPGAIQPPHAKPEAPSEASPPRLRDAERDAIIRALRESNGVVAGPNGAAARLGVKRTTLQSKMRKLGIRASGILNGQWRGSGVVQSWARCGPGFGLCCY